MKLFDKNRNKIKPEWVFNQKGNLWKFIFGGKDIIVGETRDLEKKILYIFSLNIQNGKKYLSDFLFEDGNYWISLEGANSKVVFLHRFEKPELPYHKNIIAIDILKGEKLWENEDFQYFFSTEEQLFGIVQKFDKPKIVELSIDSGSVIKTFNEDEYPALLELKRKSDDDLYTEFYDYPKSLNQYPVDSYITDIIKKEIPKSEGDIEYIIKNNKLFFNYYKEAEINLKDISKKFYLNTLCVFDITTGEKLYQDVLNKKSGFNVPDNFFCKDDFVFYLREKKDIVAIKV